MTPPNDGSRDMERAIKETAERLPPALLPLARLTYNFLWSWLPEGVDLFRDIDPVLWQRSSCNPRWLIEVVPPHRFAALAENADYLARLERVVARLDAALARPTSFAVQRELPIAYFCSEFGVHCSLPLYGGGLGLLAGDLLKGASDLGVPMVGVGLLYRQGYFHQRLDIVGWQHEYWTTTDFERTPAARVTTDGHEPLLVSVPIRGRDVLIQIWRVDVGRVPLYLLDTDLSDNHAIDRWITSRLYVGDRHTRLTQYAVLGIGGMRALEALGTTPSLVHLNEGHAAMSTVERLRRLIEQGDPVETALAKVRQSTIFTTHTPVAAGNEWYSVEEVEPVFGGFLDTLGIPRELFYDLGRFKPGTASEPVAITPLALRTCRAANGVSRRHGEVAREMWRDLWQGDPAHAVSITHVTNGVHTTTWMAPAMQRLMDHHLADGWREHVADPAVWEEIRGIPDAEIWATRRELRAALVEYVRTKTVRDRLSRGEQPAYVEAAATAFDDDTLTIGFARRVATYKRLHLLTRQLERGLRLLGNRRRPIQLVIAGKAHPSDEEAKQALRSLMEARRAPHVADHIAFLEDYDLHMAPLIVSGVDLWLNLPRPPLEASGTSGMKIVLNGGLNLSVLDGWWDEAYDGESGWAIASFKGNPEEQDDRDSATAFDLLEHEIIPLFYERDEAGVPRGWLARVRASMMRFIPRFSADRMLRDYVAYLYTTAPGAASGDAPEQG